MPTNLPDQNWTVPAFSDFADAPFAFTDYSADVIQNVILRYPNTATRDAFNGSRVAGDISFTVGRTWYDRWTGIKWLPVTPIQAIKRVQQLVNNSITLINDTELFAPLPAANSSYAVSLVVYYASSTTADIKFGLTIPAGALGTMGGTGVATTAGSFVGDGSFGANSLPGPLAFGGGGVASAGCATLEASVFTGATIGNIQLQFAQNTLDATNTTILVHSRLTVKAVD